MKAIQDFRQISLTVDASRPGFAIPAMWGHYAQKGDGVCLVFDKKEMEKKLPTNVYKGVVKYEDGYDGSIIIPLEDMDSCSDYLVEHNDTLFFTKTSDWSYEQEYRIIKEDDGNDYLDISGALMAVIICDLPNIQPEQDCVVSAKDAVLHQLAGDIPICRYALFVDEYNLTWEDSEIWNSRDLGNFVTEGIDSDSLNMNNINTND